MKFGYVCTNFNNAAFTLAAVDSLLRNAGHEIEIVVVDNASHPDDVTQLRALAARHPTVTVLESPDNTGYFRGLNLGIRHLRQARPDMHWIIAGNNDLVFGADFGDRLQQHAPALGVHAVISPDIVTLDGEHQNPHVISGISTVREIFYDLYYSNYHLGRLIHTLAKMLPSVSERHDEQQWQTAQPIYQGHGSCYVLGPRFFEQFTQLWAPTFLMAEEFFLSKQLKDVGQQVYYTPLLQVTHHWHGSLEKIPSRRRWAMARDAHREYRKHVPVFRRR